MTMQKQLASPSPSILIVDDDEITQRLMSGALNARGFGDTHIVSTLTEAGNAISDASYAAAIVDLHLPDGNGMEFVHMVRRGLTSLNRDMTIIVSSAFVSRRTSNLLLRLGATEVMRKPPDIDRIIDLIGYRRAAA